ncbi:MAG: hypothetical protein CM1200mP39_01200 [Dehalococcoidia bacterium]|nr:MAG: hypothetical protein CM1200mP39_01200 [Dehalococcoidia bacterium]
MRETGDRIKSYENDLESVLSEMNAVLLSLPNMPLEGVPDGMDEESNIIVRTSEGDTSSHGNAHWDVAPRLGILDLEAGASIAGARFFVLKGKGAKLQRALAAWMLDVQTEQHGYMEIDPPLLVRPETMTGFPATFQNSKTICIGMRKQIFGLSHGRGCAKWITSGSNY